MTRFVKLTRFDGKTIWLNPARVLWLEAARTNASGDLTDVVFSTGAEDYERVKEAPERVVADLERALLVVPPR